MGTRIIPCQVCDEYIKGAGVVVGAAGSHHDVLLELAFSPLWEGLAKTITWFDALGEHPTITVLSPNLLAPGELEVYRVPIPAEAKAVAGEMELTIKGVAVADGVESRATVAATARFRVLPGKWSPDAEESQQITPSQAEQIQAQIEAIKSHFVAAAEDAASAAASAASASADREAAQEAKETAVTSARQAVESEQAARISERTATEAAGRAEKSEKTAEDAAASATASERSAAASQEAAASSAESAGASESAAKASQQAAAVSEQRAKTAQEAAGESQKAAAASQEKAQDSAEDSEAWAVGRRGGKEVGTEDPAYQNNAKWYADLAGSIAGGDFATRTEVQNELKDHNQASDAHTDIRLATEEAQKAAENAQKTAEAAQGEAESIAKRPLLVIGEDEPLKGPVFWFDTRSQGAGKD